jgi:hypothetical protein
MGPAAADLQLVRCMLRNFCMALLGMAALSSVCAAPQVIEKRGAVTYSAGIGRIPTCATQLMSPRSPLEV